jgi:hypothetical protein
MIVPSMSWKEILREYHKDAGWVSNKATYHYTEKLRRWVVKTKAKNHIALVSGTSQNRNKWMIFSLIRDSKTIPKLVAVCIYYDKGGINALYPMTIRDSQKMGVLVRFTTHCIKRYRMRLKLDIEEPMQVVEHLSRNMILNQSTLKRIKMPGRIELYMTLEGGGFLGYYNADVKLLDSRTFISDELMKNIQIKMKNELMKFKVEDFPVMEWEKMRK